MTSKPFLYKLVPLSTERLSEKKIAEYHDRWSKFVKNDPRLDSSSINAFFNSLDPSEPKQIALFFTEKQVEKLSDILDNTNDEGPQHEGWASAELESLREIVRTNLKTLA